MDPIEHITAEQIAEMGVVAAPDRLVGNAEENKKIFDRLVRELVAVVVNQIIDNVNIMANAETERETAELNRETAEESRDTAEAARVEAEEGRVTAERERAVAEQTRQTDEERRKTAETERISDESTRQNNEQERQDQESTRQANEETRQNQESTRQANEQTRQSQEQARATAEAQREAAEAARRNTFATELNQAQTARSEAETAAKTAEAGAQYVEETKDLSKSWAVGGTGTREGEDTNNAMYWSKKAEEAAGGGVSSEQAAEIASRKVSEHDSGEMAHADIRLAISGHLTDKNNPHNVTAEQVGAIAAGAVGNLHVWKKETGSYTAKTSSGVQDIFVPNDITIQYSSDIYLASGKVALKNPAAITTPISGTQVNNKYWCAPDGNIYYAFDCYEYSNVDTGEQGTMVSSREIESVSFIAESTDYVTDKTASTYPYDDEVSGYHYTYLGRLGAQPSAEEIGAATTQDFTVSVTDAWDAVPDRGYSQRVSVSGIESSDNPIIDVVLGSDIAANALYLEAYALVTRVSTSNGAVTLWCDNDTPTVAFTIQMKVVR